MRDVDTLARRHSETARAATTAVSPPPVSSIAERAGSRPRVPREVWLAGAVILAVVLTGWAMWVARSAEEVADAPPTTVVSSDEAVLDGLPDGCAWCPGLVLDDGRALILDSRTVLSYDPSTETLTRVADLPDDFSQGSLIALPDGRVLMVPGVGEQAWVFEPSNGSFVGTSLSDQQVAGGVGTVLEDGRVLLVVQYGSGWLYESSTDETVEIGPIPDIGWIWSVVPLDDGDILFLGTGAVVYDQLREQFVDVESPQFPGGATATKLADGRVLIVGGQSLEAPYETTAGSFIYDPEGRAFTPSENMTTPRWGHAAALLADGRVLIVGGRAESPKGYDTFEIYDPMTGEFTLSEERLSQPRVSSTVLVLDDGSALVFGHYDGNVPIEPVYPNDTIEVVRP